MTLRNDSVGGLVRRITGGETFDVVLISPEGLRELASVGKIDAASVTILAKVGVGVRAGMPAPDICTVEAFQAALMNAHAVAYIDPASDESSGIYVANLFPTMGIAGAMAAKSVLVKGGPSGTDAAGRPGRSGIATDQRGPC